jgi:PAS domain S-box-containing protein
MDGPADALRADEAFRRFFLRGPLRAALCDAELRVRAASNELADLCRCAAAELVGRPLLEVLPLAPGEEPQRGPAQISWVALLPGGERLRVTAARDGELMHAVAERLEGAATTAPLVAFGRELVSLYREEDLVSALVRAARRLVPSSCVCARAVDPRTRELTSLFADGPLLPHARLRLRLPGAGQPFEAQFSGTSDGLSIPLTAHGELQGLLEVEVPASAQKALRAQEPALVALASQAATALRAARAGEDRRALEHYLDRLIDGGSALVAAVDRRGALSVFNGALEDTTGLRREQVLGRALTDLLPPSERESAEAALQAALLGAPDVTLEVHLSNTVCLFSATAVVASDGHTEGALLVGQDLTELKELEARALQAEKLATLGRLATDIAHEIVNPLTTVALYAEALHDKHRAGDQGDAQKLQRIGESADRILRFARELLSYARPVREPVEAVPLSDVIEQAAKFCQEAIDRRSATLSLRLERPALVRGHRQKLTQVFVNLMTNAAQAVPQGGHIDVSTTLREDAVEARVADDGPGIPDEVRPHLFQPFFSTKPEGEGSGLGLSIVRGIVEASGGSIEVQSGPGRGTVFTVRLPLS